MEKLPTGFFDKNGKEIHEGDSLNVFEFTFKSSGPLPEILNVVYFNGIFQLFRGSEYLWGLNVSYIKSCEIVSP